MGLAPIFFFPIWFITIPVVIYYLANASCLRQAWWIGWWWGWGFFVFGLYWTAYALLQEADKFAWMVPFSVLGVPAFIAIFPAVACLLVHYARRWLHDPVLLFIVFYTALEYGRTYLFTGFPWNLLGYSLGFHVVMLQGAAWVGIHGLGLLALCAYALPAYALLSLPKRMWVPAVFGVVTLACLTGVGMVRLMHSNTGNTPSIHLRLVQGNIPQNIKWDSQMRLGIVEKHLRMSNLPGSEKITHLIWSETAVPFVLNQYSPLHEIIAGALPDNVHLITGGIRLISGATESQDKLWNTMFVLNGTGEVEGHYDKTHLVPFGEYVPMRALLPFIDKITHGMGDFEIGTGPKTISVPNTPPFSGLVCYEGIFPQESVNKDLRPSWLVNITNDAWFGTSSGPYQHFHMVRVRAIEQGLPLVRVANSGISGVFDAYGRIRASLGLNKTGIINASLPNALAPTLYARFGDKFYGLLSVLLLVCAYYVGKNR